MTVEAESFLFFDRKEEGITGDMEFLQTGIISAKKELTRLQNPREQKTCSNCHLPGHTKEAAETHLAQGLVTANLKVNIPNLKVNWKN